MHMFWCTDKSLSGLMRHFQAAAGLIQPPRSAFLLPGNTDALSLNSMMSDDADTVLFHGQTEHI